MIFFFWPWKQPLCASVFKMGIKFPNLCPNQRLLTSKWLDQRRYRLPTTEQEEVEKKRSLVFTLLFKLILTWVFLVSLQSHCVSVWLSVCVCVLQWTVRKFGGPRGWMVCRGRLVVAEWGCWTTRGWVWCSYLLCADRTSLCLRDAALSQAKDSICVVKGIMGTLFPVSAFGKAGIRTRLSLFADHYSGM